MLFSICSQTFWNTRTNDQTYCLFIFSISIIIFCISLRDKEKTLKRKTKEDSNNIKQTERNNSLSKNKKQEYKKTNSVKAKVKKNPSLKPKKEKNSAINSSLEVKKGWWKK